MKLWNHSGKEGPDSELPMFSDADSIGEESFVDTNPSATFSTRIFVSNASTPCMSGVPVGEVMLDTTMVLEDGSDCSLEGGTELLIASSSIVEPSSDDAEARAEAEETKYASEGNTNDRTGDNRGRRGMLVFLCFFSILLVAAAVVPPIILLAGDDIDVTQLPSVITKLPSEEETPPSFLIEPVNSPGPSLNAVGTPTATPID